jgi:hypothetical protein
MKIRNPECHCVREIHITAIGFCDGVLTTHWGKRKQAQQQKADFLRHLFHIQSVLLFAAKWIMLQIYKFFSIQGEKKTVGGIK